ncbi:MAG: hypothetical protein KatS3mg096_704 [Candidatus Parcubacteria bacterium]|nr:MAG: hypothetical protein KatS3mg096_677 [Candidatus Parcubacteria bacterium]GIW67836.1 MAG: hypothetical protein KatS3mg096_704 [Candidatus Parcubacteria bacterium]
MAFYKTLHPEFDGKTERYIDDALFENLKVMAKKIVNDMTFLGIVFSSTLEVRTGKSTFASQIGECYTSLMKELHGIELPWGINNLVFRPVDLIYRSLEMPQYSCIICDEWENPKYWTELYDSLSQFFQKHGIKNQFVLILTPNFFKLPDTIAINRSVFAVDIRFGDDFERGFFKFYGFQKKKMLYLLGKKKQDYNAVKEDFRGRFVKGYGGLNTEEYIKKKIEDLERFKGDRFKKLRYVDKYGTPPELIRKLYLSLLKNKGITQKEIADVLGVEQTTISEWVLGNFSLS